MKGIVKPVEEVRRKIYSSIAKVAFDYTNDTFNDEIEAITYEIIGEKAKNRDCI